MKQNRKPRNRHVHIWSTDTNKRYQECIMGKEHNLQKMVLGKLDNHKQNNEI